MRAVCQDIQQQPLPFPALFFGLPVSPERFRAVSFYANSTLLQRCFAARQWYASCAFPLASPGETERALRLAALVAGDAELAALYRRLTVPYDNLLGPPDDADVHQYAALLQKVLGGTLDAQRIGPAVESFRSEAARLAPQGERPVVVAE